MHKFDPTVVEVKCKSLPKNSWKSIKRQGYEIKRVGGNATIVILGEVTQSAQYPIPQGLSSAKSMQPELTLYEQCTPITMEQSLVHCTASGAPLRPFWIHKEIVSPVGKDAAFSARHAIASVYYDSLVNTATIHTTAFQRIGKTVFVDVDKIWTGIVKVTQEVCPVCRSVISSCRGSRLCYKYRHRVIPAQIQLPRFAAPFHNAVVAAVRKTSGILYPLFVNPIYPVKPKLIAAA